MIDWSGIALVITASSSGIVSLVTLWRVGHVGRTAEEALAVSKKTEINTNSMSERLGLASHAAGMVEGAEVERARAAALKEAEARGRAGAVADQPSPPIRSSPTRS